MIGLNHKQFETTKIDKTRSFPRLANNKEAQSSSSMTQQQSQEFSFRLQCIKQRFENLFENLAPSQTPAKDVKKILETDKCCNKCNHVCVTCNGDCLNKPSCMKLPCKECGCKAKDCQAEKIFKAWIVFNEVAKIQENESEDFIVNKIPLKSFVYCKTANQLLSTCVQDAVKPCYMYLMNKNIITKDDQLDNQMYARMILRLPTNELQHGKFIQHDMMYDDKVEDLRTLAHQERGTRKYSLSRFTFYTFFEPFSKIAYSNCY